MVSDIYVVFSELFSIELFSLLSGIEFSVDWKLVFEFVFVFVVKSELYEFDSLLIYILEVITILFIILLNQSTLLLLLFFFDFFYFLCVIILI